MLEAVITGRPVPLTVLATLAFCFGSAGTHAEDSIYRQAAKQHPELHAAMYGFSVCEYCGLISYEVYDGFHRQQRALIAADDLSEDTVRRVRVAAWTDADLEYGDRGLGGFRNWCRTEGLQAAQGFIDFRAGELEREQTLSR